MEGPGVLGGSWGGGVGGPTTSTTGSAIAVTVSRELFRSEVRVEEAAYNDPSGLSTTIGQVLIVFMRYSSLVVSAGSSEGDDRTPQPADVSMYLDSALSE